MNLLDWLLVVLVLAYALSGYWQGFVTGAFATTGLLLGGLFGVWLAPGRPRRRQPVAAGLARRAVHRDPLRVAGPGACFQFAGSQIRDKITWQPVRAIDAVGGAALSAVAVLLVAWALGVAISGSRIGGDHPDGPQLDGARPGRRGAAGVGRRRAAGASTTWSAPASSRATSSRSPPSGSSRSVPAPSGCSSDPDVERAAASVLKIRGTNDCGRGVEGTGFLYAPDRLMTNAHVVAGVDDPEVYIGDELRRRRRRLLQPRHRRRGALLRLRRHPDAALRPRRPSRPGRRRRPRLPAGRPVRRAARPDPLRAAPALARHLRRGRGDPRGLLAARADPARQLRRPDRLLGTATSSASCSPPRSPTTTPATR